MHRADRVLVVLKHPRVNRVMTLVPQTSIAQVHGPLVLMRVKLLQVEIGMRLMLNPVLARRVQMQTTVLQVKADVLRYNPVLM